MRFSIGRQTRLPSNWRRKMADGDLLTIVAGHQAFAPAAEIVADVQTVKLVGPYTFTFADIIAAGNGIWFDVAPIAQGVTVIKIWPVIRTAFNDATNGFIYPGVGVPGGNYTGGLTMGAYPDDNLPEVTGIDPEPFESATASPPISATITATGKFLMVLYEADDILGLNQGEADIYALTATPS